MDAPELMVKLRPSSCSTLKVLVPAAKKNVPTNWISMLSALTVGSNPFCSLVNVGLFRNWPTVYPVLLLLKLIAVVVNWALGNVELMFAGSSALEESGVPVQTVPIISAMPIPEVATNAVAKSSIRFK